MGKMSFIPFSQSAGQDPMGIGVPDYGKSSFDPVDFIRRAWEDTRTKSIIKDKGKLEGYKEFEKQLPTPQAWEQNTAAELNNEILTLSNEFYSDVISGKFDPTGSSAADLQKKAEYDRKMADLRSKSDVYHAMKGKYDLAYQNIHDPTKQDIIDRDLSLQKLKAFYEESSFSKKAEMLQDDIVVVKPKETEVLDYLAKAFNTFMPGLDKDITVDDFDEKSGMWKTGTIERMDPAKLNTAMNQVWGMISEDERMFNAWKRRYDRAPRREKMSVQDGEEIIMPMEDWFKAKYSPTHAEKMSVAYKTSPESFRWRLPGKGNDGLFDTEGGREVKQVAISPDRVKEGPMHRVEAAYVIPLQGAFKSAFQMPNVAGSFDVKTGQPLNPGLTSYYLPDNISFMPVAQEAMDITYQGADGAENKMHLNKGDLVPVEVQKAMIAQNISDKYKYDAFLTSLTSNRQIDKDPSEMFLQGASEETAGFLKDLLTKQYSTGNTSMARWKDVSKYLSSRSAGSQIDMAPLETFISEYLEELNGKQQKGQDFDEKLYEELFK